MKMSEPVLRRRVKKVREAIERARVAIKRVEEAEAKSIRTVELWRASPKFNALAQDA